MRKMLPVAALLTSAAVLLDIIFNKGPSSDEPIEVRSVTSSTASPLYQSSVVGTDFDFITEDDASAFQRLEFVSFEKFEMPDKRMSGEPLIQDTYIFDAYFNDGTTVRIAADKDFGSRQAAGRDVARYTLPLGKLPSLYREKLKHIVVHTGGADTTAFAEDKGRFFVIYSGNATKRIATHDLEETFFHEATHASIQAIYLGGAEWRQAKNLDNRYVTHYAKTEEQEDFAESALFAFTLIHHPERFPAAEREALKKQIPNRIAFFRSVFAGN